MEPDRPIRYGAQSVDEDDVAAVVAALRSDWLTQGPAVEAFEETLVAATGARHAVAFANGSAALHAACIATGLGPGDRVAVPALTFAASAACVTHVGGDVVLLDVDGPTLNLDPATLPGRLDGLIAVHYAGRPIDLSRLADRPRVVIEDAAHALGALTPEGPVGGCAHSDACCLSFHPVKPITTAEGGAVTTNDDTLAARLRVVRSHGMEPRPEEGPWAYAIERAGFNLRLSDLHAALGASQMRKLERFIATRNDLADRYRRLLADLPVRVPDPVPEGWRHGYHLFPVRVAAERRRAVVEALRSRDIGVQVHYVPLHHHPAFAGAERAGRLEVTDAAYAELVSLPIHPSLTPADQDRVVGALADLLS